MGRQRVVQSGYRLSWIARVDTPLSWRRILLLVLLLALPVALLAGINVWMAREKPVPINLGTEQMRYGVWRAVLERSTPFPLTSRFTPHAPMPPPMPDDARTLRLSDASLKTCNAGALRWHCQDPARLTENHFGHMGTPALREHLFQASREQVRIEADVSDKYPMISSRVLVHALATKKQCELHEAGSYDVIVLGRPVFSPDGTQALVTVRWTNCNLPDHINGGELVYFMREEGGRWVLFDEKDGPRSLGALTVSRRPVKWQREAWP